MALTEPVDYSCVNVVSDDNSDNSDNSGEDATTMHNDIMSQGLELMLYGMGTVVAFLSLLVIATLLMSAIVRRYFAEPAPVSRPLPPSQTAPAQDAELVSVITAAIHQHRSRR